MSNQPPGSPGPAAPAGWYDDGSGRLRWWDGQRWTGQYAASVAPARPVVPPAPPRPSRHGWWTWSPAYTLGVLAFIPALHAAIALRRRTLWLWAGALIAGDLLVWGLLGAGPANPDGSNTPVQDAGALIAIALAVLGTIHAFRVRDEVFPAADLGARAAAGIDPAVAQSLAARRRREESVALSLEDPGLARDLRIGRPDLARTYDDGGLVDVNNVPEAVLVAHLGLTPAQARTVVESRERIGGFQSINELSGLADVPPRTLDAIRDRVVLLQR